ncbi:D-amino-acid transaminase [Acetobacteraceae bacterium H6797]|nr:D-amino-acid transaminase [Acetobacteraceae bacterium H6797]
MSRIAYVNGAYVPQRDASVNIEDRGYQFGDGIYEVVHIHNGRFIDEKLHLDRLERSLREMALPMPMSRAALRLIIAEMVRRNRITEGLVYMQITRGVARRDHAFPKNPVPPALVMTAKRVQDYPTNVDAWTGTAITHPDLRWDRRDIKTINLLPNCMARQAAREKGAMEAILYDDKGMVTEGAATSFWIVDEHGVIRCPPLGHAILPGCTRAALLAELDGTGLVVEDRAFSLDEMKRAREAFITSATSFVKPIVKIDGVPVADGKVGPVVRQLFEIFARHVSGGLKNAA